MVSRLWRQTRRQHFILDIYSEEVVAEHHNVHTTEYFSAQHHYSSLQHQCKSFLLPPLNTTDHTIWPRAKTRIQRPTIAGMSYQSSSQHSHLHTTTTTNNHTLKQSRISSLIDKIHSSYTPREGNMLRGVHVTRKRLALARISTDPMLIR